MIDEVLIRKVGSAYQLDTNRINAYQKDLFVNQLERWHDNGVIFLEMPRIAYDEACYGSEVRAEKAEKYTWIEVCNMTEGGSGILKTIEKILFPLGVDTGSKRNDVHIVFTARQAGATLITADGNSQKQPGGILGNADALNKIGVRVTSSHEAVKEIAHLVRERDKTARNLSENTGASLPSWVGRDDPADEINN